MGDLFKNCSKCGRHLSFASFHNSKANHDGKSRWCKECVVAYNKRRYDDPNDYRRQQHLDAADAWRTNNPEAHNEASRRWYGRNKHDPEFIKHRRKLAADWNKNNPERVQENARRWYEANKERYAETKRQYAEKIRIEKIKREQEASSGK